MEDERLLIYIGTEIRARSDTRQRNTAVIVAGLRKYSFE